MTKLSEGKPIWVVVSYLLAFFAGVLITFFILRTKPIDKRPGETFVEKQTDILKKETEDIVKSEKVKDSIFADVPKRVATETKYNKETLQKNLDKIETSVDSSRYLRNLRFIIESGEKEFKTNENK